MADTSRFPEGAVLRGINIATTAAPLNAIVESGGVLYRSLDAAVASYEAVSTAAGATVTVEDDAFTLYKTGDQTATVGFRVENQPAATATTHGLPASTATTLVGCIDATSANPTLAGATITTTETDFGAAVDFDVAANSLPIRSTLRIRAFFTFTASSGVNACTIRLRFGADGRAGTITNDEIIAESAAFDGAVNDVIVVDCSVTVRSGGATATVVSSALTTAGTPGGTTNLEPYVLQAAGTSIDLTGVTYINATAQFANGTAKDIRLDQLIVDMTTDR